MRYLKWAGLFLILAFVLVLGACSDGNNDNSSNKQSSPSDDGATNNNGNNDSEVDEDREPVTLKFMASAAIGDVEGYWKPLIEEKLPHITIEYFEENLAHAHRIEEMIAAKNFPDIVFSSVSDGARTLEQFELGYDLSELIELNNFDLSRFEPEHLEGWTTWSNGEIWLLPFMKDIFALHYNKDIFDAFGVPYPTDDMTWNEVVELAKSVTGERNGVQYRGLHMADMSFTALSQVSGDIQFVDPETLDILWTENPSVIDFLEMTEAAHTIPGNEFPGVPEEMSPYGAFLEGTLAMLPRWFLRPAVEDGIDWDIVTFPQWEENLGTGPTPEGWGLGITATSEHKEEAFEVLELLFSDEHIMDLAETPLHAPYPHLHDSGASIAHLNEEDHGHFMDKNLEALSKLTPAGAPESRSKYDSAATNAMGGIAYQYLDSGKDINTFLREVREQEEVRVLEEAEKE